MTTHIEKLTKILHLEAEKYQDRAVYGGLARYAETWLQEARIAFGPNAHNWVQQVANRLREYSRLTEEPARQEAVASLLGILENAPDFQAPDQGQEQSSDGLPPSLPASKTPAPLPASAPTPTQPPETQRTGLDSSVTALQGVGPRQSERLTKLGIHTIRDHCPGLGCRYPQDPKRWQPVQSHPFRRHRLHRCYLV